MITPLTAMAYLDFTLMLGVNAAKTAATSNGAIVAKKVVKAMINVSNTFIWHQGPATHHI